MKINCSSNSLLWLCKTR